MPSTAIEQKLYDAALVTPALTALLGTGVDAAHPFRWYDTQLDERSTFPAVTVLLVSAVSQYSVTARLWTARCRVQFTIWDTIASRARDVENALMVFLDTFNPMNTVPTTTISPCQVLNRRQGGNPQTQPLTFWRTVDVSIWNNEQLSS